MGKGTEYWSVLKKLFYSLFRKEDSVRSDHILWLNSIEEPTEDSDLISLRGLVSDLKEIQSQLNEDTDFNSNSSQVRTHAQLRELVLHVVPTP